MKKIGILTQPLHNNYGGLLQAYALQSFLKKQGYDALTIDFSSGRKPRLWGLKGIVLNVIRKYFLKQEIKSVFPLSDVKKANIGLHTRRFVTENIFTTERVSNIEQFSSLKPYNFDAYIVGSDQVWRPAYSPGMPAFFLDFLGHDTQTKRIAYAASFGNDNCDEFTSPELIRYATLAQKFDAIAVREGSAVELCKRHFCVTAQHVLDPTLLLEKDNYIELIKNDSIGPSAGNMMVYVLDRSSEKEKMINQVAQTCSLIPFSVMPNEATGVYPPVTQWLRGFMDAEYVVTDSFHGVAFSIIFNKQFIAIGNPERGLARFTSILKKFNLESRLVLSPSDLTADKINAKIDFSVVNETKNTEQQFSLDFLHNALTRIK